MASRFLTAEWRDLAMLSYEVDPAILLDLVPFGTELDSWQGRTLVRDFDEVNLRFYVRRKAPDGWRRGVVFVKEIVPRPAIAWVARVAYNENYVALPMRHSVAPLANGSGRRVSYEWFHASRWCRLEVLAPGTPELPPPDSEEVFITEHYWGYAKQQRGPTKEYQVEHPQWRVSRGQDAVLSCEASELYGPRFAEFLIRPPTSAFVAEGSAVTVRNGVALRGSGL